MSDSVRLQIGGKGGYRLERFQSYTIDADLYTAADAFSFDLPAGVSQPNPEPGQQCELFVNGEMELTGIIDSVTTSYDKNGRKHQVKGRDLMGILVDSYCEKFGSIHNKNVKQLAEQLVAKLPFIGREQIKYQEVFTGKLAGKKQTASNPFDAFLDTPQKISAIEPGMTVFEVLATYAASRGLMFFGMPDGTLVFGKPREERGEPLYSLVCAPTGTGTNVLDGSLTTDLSRRWSTVTVIGQQQGQDAFATNAAKVNITGTATDPKFPFHKPYVAKSNNDSQSPKLRATWLLEKMRHDGLQLRYKVARHSQDGKNWRINELVRVNDEVLNIKGTWLIYGRTLELSKDGCYTTLHLGPPGLAKQVQ